MSRLSYRLLLAFLDEREVQGRASYDVTEVPRVQLRADYHSASGVGSENVTVGIIGSLKAETERETIYKRSRHGTMKLAKALW